MKSKQRVATHKRYISCHLDKVTSYNNHRACKLLLGTKVVGARKLLSLDSANKLKEKSLKKSEGEPIVIRKEHIIK